MTEAVAAFVPWAFERYSLTRIYAHVFEFNVASTRVLEKAGFACEGRLRKAVIKNGQVLDQLMYARIREDGYLRRRRVAGKRASAQRAGPEAFPTP